MSDGAGDGPETYIGKPVLRLENEALLRGLGQYVDDVGGRPNTLEAAILRSPHAHARILSIETSAASELPGVHAVITGADAAAYCDPFLIGFDTPMECRALAIEKVRHVGDPIAVVVADNRYVAEDAVELIDVEYELLPAVVETMEAVETDAPVLHEAVGSNVVSTRHFKYGEPEAAFESADYTTSIEINYPRNAIMPMEGYAVVAEFEPGTGVYDVLCNFHGPFSLHTVMSRSLRVSGNKLRLRTAKNSGGSFGTKLTVFPYVVLMAVAARIVGRPVKWIEDRLENLSAACSAPSRVSYLEAAHDSEGRISAIRFRHFDDHGAYLRAPMPAPIYRMHGVCTSCYDIRNIEETINIVVTNRIPSGAVRGFGGSQHYFGLERLMARIAKRLERDPIEVIRTNFIPRDAFPHEIPSGALLDSGDYHQVLEDTVTNGRLDELKTRRDKARKEGRLYGIGYAAALEPSTSNMGYIATLKPAEERARIGPKDGNISYATVNIDAVGGVTVKTESAPQGQGHATAIAQVTAERLGIDPNDIEVHTDVDTGRDPWSIAAGNYSNRFGPATMSAVARAAERVRDKLARIAVAQLNVSTDEVEFAGGMIRAKSNPDNAVPLRKVAGLAHWSPSSLPPGVEAGVSETEAWSPPELTPTGERDEINAQLTYGFGFDFCDVEIDPDTAEVRIDRFVSGHDCGTIINPGLAHGQIEGSFAASVGAALYEEFVYGEDGSFLTGTFADYLIPTAAEMPRLEHAETVNTPSPFTELGTKGLAEGNCFTTPVCIANAVADALDLDDVELPLTPNRLAEYVFGPEPEPPENVREKEAHTARAGLLKGADEFHIAADPATVWAAFTDPKSLQDIIPGCSGLTERAPNVYAADLQIGVGPVRGTFAAEVSLDIVRDGEALRLNGEMTGALGASSGHGDLVLAPDDGGTMVHYEYTVQLQGKVAAVGGRMLRGAAQALINRFFKGLEMKLVPGDGETSRDAERGWLSRVLGRTQ